MSDTKPALPFGGVIKLTAKPDTAEELAEFLGGWGLDLANEEPGTAAWVALRTDEVTFWVCSAFASEADQEANLEGSIAIAIMASSERMLAEAPQMMPATVLASKLPD